MQSNLLYFSDQLLWRFEVAIVSVMCGFFVFYRVPDKLWLSELQQIVVPSIIAGFSAGRYANRLIQLVNC